MKATIKKINRKIGFLHIYGIANCVNVDQITIGENVSFVIEKIVELKNIKIS